jgi:hypothetical protein
MRIESLVNGGLLRPRVILKVCASLLAILANCIICVRYKTLFTVCLKSLALAYQGWS